MINLQKLLNTDSIDTSPAAVRKTGGAFMIVGSILGVVIILMNSHTGGWGGWDLVSGLQSETWRWFAGAGAVIYLMFRFFCNLMKPVHKAWMMIALMLGWLSSHLLLSIYFYLVITPTGLFMRLTGKDLLDEKPDITAETYWVKRKKRSFNRKDYERLF